MPKSVASALALIAASLPVTVVAAPITYASVQQVGGSTATLSIVTDGTLGTLSAANILSVSATLFDGATTVTLLRDLAAGTGNASTTITSQLQASAGSLVLPYLPAATNNEFAILGAGYANWYAAGQGSVVSLTSHNSIKIGANLADVPLTRDLVLGTAAVADAVPEPATWAMMIAGLGMTGAAMRRRKVVVRLA